MASLLLINLISEHNIFISKSPFRSTLSITVLYSSKSFCNPNKLDILLLIVLLTFFTFAAKLGEANPIDVRIQNARIAATDPIRNNLEWYFFLFGSALKVLVIFWFSKEGISMFSSSALPLINSSNDLSSIINNLLFFSNKDS